jgi:hypothetical protein
MTLQSGQRSRRFRGRARGPIRVVVDGHVHVRADALVRPPCLLDDAHAPSQPLELRSDRQVDAVGVPGRHRDRPRPGRGDVDGHLGKRRVPPANRPATQVVELHRIASEQTLKREQRTLEIGDGKRSTPDLAERRVSLREPDRDAAVRLGLERQRR